MWEACGAEVQKDQQRGEEQRRGGAEKREGEQRRRSSIGCMPHKDPALEESRE